MRFILTFVFLCLFTLSSFAGDEYKIEFEVQNYEYDTLVIGVFYGDRQLVKDSLFRESNGKFVFKGEEKLDAGVYMMLVQPDNKFIQFMVPEDDQKFKLKVDANDLQKLEFKGSRDNEVFSRYLSFITEQNKRLKELSKERDLKKEKDEDVTLIEKELDDLDESVLSYLDSIVAENPEAISSLVLKSNFNIDIPDFEGTDDEVSMARYIYYKNHYFDHIALDNDASLRTPFLHKKVDYFINKLTPQHPDSIIESIDRVLEGVKPAEDTHMFYVSYFLNAYAKSKIVGMDAVYVHMVDKYYKTGLADWVDQETLLKIVDRSEKIKPVLIGKIAPDVTLYREDGIPVNIHDIQSEYLVLMFWAPDCGHCKKTTPFVVDFYDNYKEKGVELIAICTKHQKKYPSCWEAVKEKDMVRFLNLGDQYHKSRFKLKYNVTTTPKIFILDRNKEIIMKNIGGEQLETIMDEIIELDKKRKSQG